MDTSTQIKKMQAARALRLGDKSPRQVGAEKANLVLLWIYRWGWASPTTVGLVGSDNQNGLAARLVRRGFLNKIRTESGGGQRDVPAYILTLTELGRHEVERLITDPDDLLPYDVDPYRINQTLLRHDHMAQTATAKALASGTISGYQTERELRQKSQKSMKQPDVVWQQGSDHLTAVEIELSAKWERDLDQFVRSCIYAMTEGRNGEPPRFQHIAVVSDAPAIVTRYKRAFSPGASYGIWKRDEKSRHWKQERTAEVPDWVEERMLWKLVEHR
ncbi:MAG: hypothetical protein CDV28_1682 [Candidatus Electronema aureum]|uniref:Replication-relaxation n=1 Tax=Candidatus Electronema aureum TaxID=2005002 RepID=A0A521FY69_9BACT|nr:MAG: hypothetical protein CDV28_1682 [Candidatus Electronema aureum]